LRKESGISYRPIEAFVAAHRQAGQQYLIPSKLYDFRLEAGVPIYIDFLSIPYKSTDVLEWRRRSLLANRFYQEGTCDNLVDFGGVTRHPVNDFRKIAHVGGRSKTSSSLRIDSIKIPGYRRISS
jgi:hypothetical protein